MSYNGDLSVTPSEVPESDNGIPIPSISITPANEAGAIQDEVAMAKPASNAQVPLQSLKIWIQRPANMATEVACTPSPNPEVEISPSAKVKHSRPSQTKTELAPAPASTLDIAPAKRFRPNKVVLVSDHSQSPLDSRSLPKSGCSGGSKESELSSSHSQSPAVPATRGRPKKVPEPDTSLNFKKKPLADGNGERHAEPATFLAVPLPAVTTATASKRARAAKKATSNRARQKKPPATADMGRPSSSASKIVAFWNENESRGVISASEVIKPSTGSRRDRKARGASGV
ncbi:hypothetical protein PtA15_9A336 [Puccinia triticina]|uniref:Shugoshin C-terminal domain-containing protein n=1 Tax=Puccinia triticina TaxID=208348 RepID=A0ABY7CUB1_9BASI|nr:uncharacterized protein PtA15_9A336 [Puccinia triticina]WAQ88209.1 hypothetical protein PtA15_9A336 [Puccinia triticina]